MEPVDSVAGLEPVPEADRSPGRLAERVTALFEVVLCSSFPTQIAIAYVMGRAGSVPFDQHGRLSFLFVVGLALADSVVLVGLIFLFLHLHGESPRAMFLGDSSLVREAVLGLACIPLIVGIVVAVLLGVQNFAPWLHNVRSNPLEGLIESRTDAGLFAIVAIVGGGVREEIQRAFILRRFELHLGGAWVGVLLFSIVFGIGHILQGRDAAITTGILGAVWGLIYLRRRSVLAPLVSHAGFNAAEILRYTVLGR